MIKWASSAAPKLLGKIVVGDKNRISNRLTITNTYVTVKRNIVEEQRCIISIPWKFLKICHAKGYYRVYIKGALNKREISNLWEGRFFFYNYRRPFPRDLKRNDLLVLEHNRKQTIPKTRAAILDIIH